MSDAVPHSHSLLHREMWRHFALAIRRFAASEVGTKAIGAFALLMALLLAINGLNVINSYVGRDFMTAIESRDTAGFVRHASRYVTIFALSTIVAVVFRFLEERLGLAWRESMTRQLVHGYLRHRAYYRLHVSAGIANPDQRIADDVRAFTTTTLSLVLMLLNGTVTVVAFSGVLWSISPLLFVIGVVYASVGSIVTVLLGRQLVGLNYRQSDREADFRADLVHVGANAESVALLHREGRLESRLLRHVDALTANLRRIIAVNRSVGFFTTGYNYMIQIIPALMIAPLFIRGEVEFGVITQAAMAFSSLLGAFSLIVTQFQSISSYAAVAARLSDLTDALQHTASVAGSGIVIVQDGDRLAYERLTLRSPRDDRILVRELDVSVPHAQRLLIEGPDDTAKVALLRATAGMWDRGEGRIVRPGPDDLLFLPERPYLPPGTLRDALVRTGHEGAVTDEQLLNVMRMVGVEKVFARAGGLDVERDWDDILSLDEQQLLVFIRLLIAAPRFAFLDRVGTALHPDQIDRILDTLSVHGIAYVTIGNGADRRERYDTVLELDARGDWRSTPLRV